MLRPTPPDPTVPYRRSLATDLAAQGDAAFGGYGIGGPFAARAGISRRIAPDHRRGYWTNGGRTWVRSTGLIEQGARQYEQRQGLQTWMLQNT
jgi:hypothetical protein